ncbi:MAG TPA: zinc ribbon domain-containing protein [Pyrinomonadaceae bacterium]|nr:zinc ribbon domain-containing protein [Pyrinomonadaceae bacterium]
MSKCNNCGNMNGPDSNFCRACGQKMIGPQTFAPPQAQPFDHSAPRPYSWKTDEFSTNTEARKQIPTAPINQPIELRPPVGLANYRCPYCTSTYLPRHERKISTAGWITFAVLLVFFFPLFWVGFLIKEDTFVCPSCLKKVN